MVYIDSEVFAHQPHAESVRELADLVGLSCHVRVEHFGVPHNGSNFRVARAQHRPFVDVCRSDDGDTIIHYHDLGVDVQLFCNKHLGRSNLTPGPQSVELNVVFWLDVGSSKSSEERRFSTADTVVLTGHDETDTATILLINSVLVSRHEREDDAGSPVFIVGMCTLDAVNKGIVDLIFDLCT